MSELMSDEQFAASVKSIIDDAVDYVDGFVAPTRALATQYYRGDPLGNEEAGRSQVVMTELRDVVEYVASLKDGSQGTAAPLPRALRGLPTPPKAAE